MDDSTLTTSVGNRFSFIDANNFQHNSDAVRTIQTLTSSTSVHNSHQSHNWHAHQNHRVRATTLSVLPNNSNRNNSNGNSNDRDINISHEDINSNNIDDNNDASTTDNNNIIQTTTATSTITTSTTTSTSATTTIHNSHNMNYSTSSPTHPHRHIICNIDSYNNHNIGISNTSTHNTNIYAGNSTTTNNNSTHHSAPFNISYRALASHALPCASAIPSIGIRSTLPTTTSDNNGIVNNNQYSTS